MGITTTRSFAILDNQGNKLNMKKINFSISEIIEIYNTIPHILYNKVTKVNLESSYTSSKEQLLIEVKNGSYWIIKTEDEKEWLLPSNKSTINQHNNQKIQSFFEFQAYDNSENKDFVLVQPAIVSLLPNASRKEWKLETLGVLNFDPNHSNNQLRSQLKLTEKEQLNPQVAQLASDFLENICASLVTKNEFNQQINRVLQKIDSLEQKLRVYPSPNELSQVIQNIIETVQDNNTVIQGNLLTIDEQLKTFQQKGLQTQKQLNKLQNLSTKLDRLKHYEELENKINYHKDKQIDSSLQQQKSEYQPKTELGKKLWKLRQKIVADPSVQLKNWEEIEAEIDDIRGRNR